MKLKLLISILVLIYSSAAIADDHRSLFKRPVFPLSINVNGGGTFGPTIPLDQPTFCFGENSVGQCVLFFGSAKACENIDPCLPSSSPSRDTVAAVIGQTVVEPDGLFFCYGQNSLGQCTLFLGSERSCENLEPCQTQLDLAVD